MLFFCSRKLKRLKKFHTTINWFYIITLSVIYSCQKNIDNRILNFELSYNSKKLPLNKKNHFYFVIYFTQCWKKIISYWFVSEKFVQAFFQRRLYYSTFNFTLTFRIAVNELIFLLQIKLYISVLLLYLELLLGKCISVVDKGLIIVVQAIKFRLELMLLGWCKHFH